MPEEIIRVSQRHYGNESLESGYTRTVQSGATMTVASGGTLSVAAGATFTNGGASVGGLLTSSTTTAGTPATTAETDLWTYALPAATLAVNGRAVRVTVWGTFAANSNTKTFKLYFGSTVVSTLATGANGVPWTASAVVIRSGAATQLATARVEAGSGTATASLLTTPTEALSGAVTIKVSGQSSVGTLNDMVLTSVIVELI